MAAVFATCLLFQLPGDAPNWHATWSEAQRVARLENKPILAVLH